MVPKDKRDKWTKIVKNMGITDTFIKQLQKFSVSRDLLSDDRMEIGEIYLTCVNDLKKLQRKQRKDIKKYEKF